MFPETRLRRLRNNKQIREMLDISPPYPNKFIWPTFVVPGKNIKEPIKSMPGQYRYSVDMLVNDLGKIVESGIGGVLLFGSTEEENKNAHGHASFDQDGVVQQAIHKIKEKYSSFTVIADICVCAFTDHGHCGTLDKDKLVNNDETLVTLSSMAKSMCDAGVDIVAPSSMMDGQVHAIREKLDSNNYENKIIMSYSTKFASSLYDPFRDAENSQPSSGDRKAYQASYANLDLALRESEFDEDEGADILMVKPALFYLDVLSKIKASTDLPVAAYNVSGEYSMVMSSTFDEQSRANLVREIFHSFKRAGADIIVSYHARAAFEGHWLD